MSYARYCRMPAEASPRTNNNAHMWHHVFTHQGAAILKLCRSKPSDMTAYFGYYSRAYNFKKEINIPGQVKLLDGPMAPMLFWRKAYNKIVPNGTFVEFFAATHCHELKTHLPAYCILLFLK